MNRAILLIMLVFMFCSSKGQTTNSVEVDSTFKVFPNPTHGQFYVTTQGQVIYAMLITSNGSKRYEYSPYDIPSYQNQFGFGCTQAGCAGAFVASNFICTLQRRTMEDGLYYLVLFDDLGHVYHTMIVFN